MGQDMALFICNVYKNHLKNRAETMLYQAREINEQVHLDFLGPFHNMYILSIVDPCMKWIEICPCTSNN